MTDDYALCRQADKTILHHDILLTYLLTRFLLLLLKLFGDLLRYAILLVKLPRGLHNAMLGLNNL